MKFLNRLYDLVLKYTCVKGSIFIAASIMLLCGKIDAYWWGLFAAIFVGIRTVEKAIDAFRGSKND